MTRYVLAILLALPSTPAVGDVVGRASVIDGDTLDIHGQRFRIFGIDAPESAQLCDDKEGHKYRCGQSAALALADLIGQRPVTCVTKDRDRYKRDIAICTVGGVDVGRWMVSNGQAVAYRQYSMAYVDVEASAFKGKTGLWSGSFQAPWDYRSAKRKQPATKQ